MSATCNQQPPERAILVAQRKIEHDDSENHDNNTAWGKSSKLHMHISYKQKITNQ